MVRLAAFPKCYLDDIIVHKTMSVFEWIEIAGTLGVDGLEMHNLFFEGKEDRFIEEVKEACAGQGLSIPMMCFSPDFTQPDPKDRLAELDKPTNSDRFRIRSAFFRKKRNGCATPVYR